MREASRLTVQVVNPSYVAGKQPETLSVFSISSEGETLFDAYHELNSLTSKVLYLPHLSVIVIDEAIAKDGINTVLDFVLRNAAIRPNITVAIANNAPAADILHVLVPSVSNSHYSIRFIIKYVRKMYRKTGKL